MRDLAKPRRRSSTHLIGRAVVAFQVGKARLDCRVAAFEAVILGIGQNRRIRLVVGRIRLSQNVCKPRQFLRGLILCKLFDRYLCRHALPPNLANMPMA